MDKSKFRVLIVEDDQTHGKALFEAFERAGYSAVLCPSSAEALSVARRMEFHCLVLDCMLPKLNGVDLAVEIMDLIPKKPKVFLLSGVFRDKNFIRDALAQTGAEAYLLKPIDLKDLLETVDRSFPQFRSAEMPSVLPFYSSDDLDDNAALSMIDREPSLHAFHLAKLYQRLQETQLTGELNIVNSSGAESAVCFYQGHIFSVRTPDRSSFFGNVAISQGYVAAEDVLSALHDPTPKILGQKLIDAMSLSPHAVQLILEEQLALRLSQTIQDDVIHMKWESKEFNPPHFVLAEVRFDQLTEDWLESKFTDQWLRSTLMAWGQFVLEGDFHPRIRDPRTIEELFADSSFDSEKDPFAVFRALVNGRAFVGERGEKTQDFSFLESRLNRLTEDFKTQNYFQFLGVSEKAQPRELNRAYEAMVEAFNPNMLPQNCPPALLAKCTKVFSHIQRAYATLVDDVERQRYLHILQNKRALEMAEAEPQFRSAVLELQHGRAREAAKVFQALLDRKFEFKDLRSYRIWAGLKMDRMYNELRLDHVPPEERHSAAFLMAKGVHHMTKNQFRKALDCFQSAHILEPTMRTAKSELRKMKAELEKNKTANREILKDITSVTATIYGRPRRSA